jgi:hypothetical protein
MLSIHSSNAALGKCTSRRAVAAINKRICVRVMTAGEQQEVGAGRCNEWSACSSLSCPPRPPCDPCLG